MSAPPFVVIRAYDAKISPGRDDTTADVADSVAMTSDTLIRAAGPSATAAAIIGIPPTSTTS